MKLFDLSGSKVDDLVQALGVSGISKSQVSELWREIDERVNAFLNRPLEGEWPYLWLDATYLKVREGGRVVSVTAIIAAVSIATAAARSLNRRSARRGGCVLGRLPAQPP